MEEYKAVQADMQHKKKKNGLVAAIVIVIILALAAVGGTWYYMNNKAKNDKKAQEEQIQQLQKQIDDLKRQAETITSGADTSSWATYSLSTINSTFKYPSDWVISKPGINVDDLELVRASSPNETGGFNINFEVTKQGGALDKEQNSSKTNMTSIDSFIYNGQSAYILTESGSSNYLIPILSSNSGLIRSVLAPNGNIIRVTITAKGGVQQPPAFTPDAPVFQIAKNIVKTLKVK